MSIHLSVIKFAALVLAPKCGREVFMGDLIEGYEALQQDQGTTSASLWLTMECIGSAPHLIVWRLTRRGSMIHHSNPDAFQLNHISGKETLWHTLRLFRSFYWQCLGLFLIIHFPFRILVHFIVSTDWTANPTLRTGSMMLVLLVSWTLTEGAILALLVQHRRGGETSMRSALMTSFRKFPQFVIARALFLLAVLSASVFLLIPGIAVGCLLMLHGWLVFDADAGPVAALKGSFDLVYRRVRQTLGASLPVLGATIGWLVAGAAVVAVTLQLVSQIMPIFKIAPLTMTIMESGMLLFTLLTGLFYVTYRSQ